MVLFGVYEWTQPQLKKVYPTDSVFDTAFGLLKPQFLQIWGRTNPTYVSMHIYTNMYIYIYIYIHTQHMYISEYVYSGFNPSQNLKTMSQMELLIPCRIGCASFNSFDQWGAFPIHHRFTYTLIFNEYHSGVTRMISTIVRPNIYWIYTYIYIYLSIYTNGSWPWAVKTFPAANLFLRQPCVNQVALWGLTHCCVKPTRLHLHGWHSWFSTYQKKKVGVCVWQSYMTWKIVHVYGMYIHSSWVYFKDLYRYVYVRTCA